MGIEIDLTERRPSIEQILAVRKQLEQLEIRRQIDPLRDLIDDVDDRIVQLLTHIDFNGGVDVSQALSRDYKDLSGLLNEVIPILVEMDVLNETTYSGLIELLRDRAKVVDELGLYKKSKGLPVYDRDREVLHTEELVRKHPGQEDLIRGLFPIMYRHFRARQNGNQHNCQSGEQEREYIEG